MALEPHIKQFIWISCITTIIFHYTVGGRSLLASTGMLGVSWILAIGLFKASVSSPSDSNYSWLLVRDRPLFKPVRRRPKWKRPIGRTFNSVKSGTLNKLPPEIRLLIFEHVLGGKVLHLVETDQGMDLRPCLCEDNVEAWYHPCWKITGPGSNLRTLRSMVPLLLTCRYIYSEAIEVLYTTNTFHFLRPRDLIAFARSVPPQHVNLIRSVKLYVNPISTRLDEQYGAVCPILKRLPKLRELRLLIAPSSMTQDMWKEHEASLLEPIKRFDGELLVFDVFLSVFPNWIGEEYSDSCHIRPIKSLKQLQGAHLSRYSWSRYS